MVGFFNEPKYRRECGCGAVIIIEPGNYFHFLWEGEMGSNKKSEITTLWGVLIVAKWPRLDKI